MRGCSSAWRVNYPCHLAWCSLRWRAIWRASGRDKAARSLRAACAKKEFATERRISLIQGFQDAGRAETTQHCGDCDACGSSGRSVRVQLRRAGSDPVPAFAQAREKARATQCMSNLKQLSLAMLTYAADYDDRLPPAPRWSDSIAARIRDPITFRCPSVPPGKFGYAMNSRLSHQRISELVDSHTTPLLYDSSNLERNAHDAFSSLPNPPRHVQVNNVVYADGHVRAVPAQAP
ncbi:MAG: DUF1559 domain-containing protein [Fimbriimonadales bacterium]|nr:DUF1559 domain-containing protein [Fimbriimonadales bacterium]